MVWHAVCQINQDDDLCLLCDSCNRCFHTYCVGLSDVPDRHIEWFCPDCDVYGEWKSNQQHLSAQQAPVAQAAPATALTHATRGSAVPLNSSLPRVRSRTALPISQPGRALRASRRPAPASNNRSGIIEIDDDSDTESCDSDTPLALLRLNAQTRAEAIRSNTDATLAHPSRRTEQCAPPCNTCSDDRPRTSSCPEDAVQVLPQPQEAAHEADVPQLDGPQIRPRLRRAAQAARPNASSARPSRVHLRSGEPWDLTGDDDGAAAGPSAPSPSRTQGAKAGECGHPETPEKTCAHKRVREGAAGCSGFEVGFICNAHMMFWGAELSRSVHGSPWQALLPQQLHALIHSFANSGMSQSSAQRLPCLRRQLQSPFGYTCRGAVWETAQMVQVGPCREIMHAVSTRAPYGGPPALASEQQGPTLDFMPSGSRTHLRFRGRVRRHACDCQRRSRAGRSSPPAQFAFATLPPANQNQEALKIVLERGRVAVM